MKLKALSEMMATMLLIGMLVLAFNVSQAKSSATPAGWSQTYGGTGDDEAYSVIQTSDGGYALAGYTDSYGAYSFQYDFWLVKTDASGNAQWNRTYGGTGNDQAYALVQTSDGGYALAGRTNSFGAGQYDFWLVKTDYAGNMQWNKTYGGTSYDYAYSVVQTSDGGYALAGHTRSFGAGSTDFWLVKTDASGNAQWNKTYGGTEFDAAYALVETGDGGYALAGITLSYGASNSDFWLVKTDENGVIPEFPSFLMLPLFAALTIIAVVLAKKRLPKKVGA
jgi:hypothetical protein